MRQRLEAGWLLVQPERSINAPFSIPGDVHSALLAEGLIADPYFRDNEYAVDWVHQASWAIERNFELEPGFLEGRCVLQFDQLDCIGSVFINDALVAKTESQFIHFNVDVTEFVTSGKNHIRILFDSASAVAKQRAEAFPFELPYLSWNCRVPHNNMLRKTPCHAGWDWNICLMPLGIYGELSLLSVKTHFIEDIKFEQTFHDDNVSLQVTAYVQVVQATTVACELSVANAVGATQELLSPGLQKLTWSLDVIKPDLWWPVGRGAQRRYPISIKIGDQQLSEQIGFRKIKIVQTPDASGAGFELSVNNQSLFMRGANWIPADALPQRIEPETVRELLQSAVDANMNMLRVWGGGQYEPDWFYDLCDEFGILVWQDFMFSCNHYPAADAGWLELVKEEATQQVRRLSKHPCLALWCGDNELVGALKWWEVTRSNRDRYLANYSRLNHSLELTTQTEINDVDFWPSSPSVGQLDFGDGWKNDAAGDMHFWDVWHEAKPFSAYQDIHPRFCSEFGFQSFPSYPVIKTFTDAKDRNVSSPIMEVHQRNVGGNARIVETLVRYFKFPDSFERMVFLSQCQQAMAIKTAVEYWRMLKPHCMGTLYWQLNDTWPVASWASLEYGGGWKLLHYAARRFYQPVLVAMVPGNEKFSIAGPMQLKVVSDLADSISLQIELNAYTENGEIVKTSSYTVDVAADGVVLIDTFEPEARAAIAYYRWSWRYTSDTAHGHDLSVEGEVFHNEYWLKPYKDLSLPTPKVEAVVTQQEDKPCIVLTTDKPAYFVSVNIGGNQIFSDNGFTLLPGEVKRLFVSRVLKNPRIPMLEDVVVQHL